MYDPIDHEYCSTMTYETFSQILYIACHTASVIWDRLIYYYNKPSADLQGGRCENGSCSVHRN